MRFSLAAVKPLYLVIAVVILSHMSYSGLRLSVSLYALHLQASPLVVGFLLSLFSFLPMLGLVPLGRYVDRRGMRVPMLAGSLTLAVCTLLAGLWGSMVSLFIVAALAGACYFSVFVPVQQLVGRYSTAQNRTHNFVLMGICFSVSSTISPVVSGFLIDHAGFTWAFLAMTAMPLVAAGFVAADKLPDTGPSKTAMQATGAAQAREGGPAQGGQAVKAGVRGLVGDPGLRRLYAYGIMFTVSWDVFLFLTPIYGTYLKLSASQIGMVIGSFSVGTFLVRMFSMRLTRRFTNWQLLLIALTGMATGCLAYGFAGTTVLLMACAGIMGFGHGLANPILNSLLYETSPPGRVAEAMGLRMSIGKVFQIVLPTVSGAVSSLFGVAPMFWLVSAIQFGTVYATRRQWRGHRPPGAA